MNGFKGFDKNLKCRDKKYTVGKTYEEPEAELCKKGFHFVEYPMDAFEYYHPADSRYAEIEAEDVTDERSGDSKRVCKKMTIKTELSLKGIIEASVKFILEKIDWDNKKETNTGNKSAATNTGNKSAATNTGYQSAATNTGYQSAATNTGDQSAAIVKGKNSVALSMGREAKAAGVIGSWIVLAEWKYDEIKSEWEIKTVKSAKVDGKRIKPDTYYTLVEGKFVEGKKIKGEPTV